MKNRYDPENVETGVPTRESISTFDQNDWKLFDTILKEELTAIAKRAYEQTARTSDIDKARTETAELIRANVGYKFFRSSVSIPFGYARTRINNMETRLREEGFGNAIDTLLVDKKNVYIFHANIEVLLPKVLEGVFVVPGIQQTTPTGQSEA